jgi:hypothetical protein
LKDYNEQQTLQLLQQAFKSSTAGRFSGLLNIYHNSKGNGPYDFGWNEHKGDTFARCGRKFNADEFGNYVAGFQGAAYDQKYYPHGLAESLVEEFGVYQTRANALLRDAMLCDLNPKRRKKEEGWLASH